jgi:hypothetical protein
VEVEEEEAGEGPPLPAAPLLHQSVQSPRSWLQYRSASETQLRSKSITRTWE